MRRNVDSLIVTGGTPSGCVRATVVDANAYGYRVAVVEGAVFDRWEISHHVSLFDLDAKYADVVTVDNVLHRLET
jgi:nicotinamidase-related amidase